MKKKFAVTVCLEGFFKGCVDLTEFSSRLEMSDGEIYTVGSDVHLKVCNIEVDLGFDVNDAVKMAEAQRKEMQLAKIKEKEAELAAMRAAFEKQEQAA